MDPNICSSHGSAGCMVFVGTYVLLAVVEGHLQNFGGLPKHIMQLKAVSKLRSPDSLYLRSFISYNYITPVNNYSTTHTQLNSSA
jgi:hypothetical protein